MSRWRCQRRLRLVWPRAARPVVGSRDDGAHARSMLIPREAAALLLVALVACRGDRTDTAPGMRPAAPGRGGGAGGDRRTRRSARALARPPVDEAALALAASATVRREPPSTFIVGAAARRAAWPRQPRRRLPGQARAILPQVARRRSRRARTVVGHASLSASGPNSSRADSGLVNGDLLLGVDDMPSTRRRRSTQSPSTSARRRRLPLHVAARRPSRDAGPVDLVWRFVPD